MLRLLASVAVATFVAGVSAQPAPAVDPSRRAAANAPAQASIDAVDVEQVERLAPGVPLRFAVYGSARATVTLYIEGARTLLTLDEKEPGIYEATYTIGAGDAIRPGSRVVATMERRGQVVRAPLDEPLVLAAANRLPWNAGTSTVVSAPAVSPGTSTRASTSDALAAPGYSSMSPAAAATATYASTREAVPPLPAHNGEPVPAATPTATPMRATGIAVVETSAPMPSTQALAAPRACADCAIVESVQAVAAPPPRGPLGKVSGAVIGALFGDDVAEDHLRRVRKVLGPLGKPLVGSGEAAADAPVRYDVVLRLPDGSTRVRRYDAAPGLQPGDAVPLAVSSPR